MYDTNSSKLLCQKTINFHAFCICRSGNCALFKNRKGIRAYVINLSCTTTEQTSCQSRSLGWQSTRSLMCSLFPFPSSFIAPYNKNLFWHSNIQFMGFKVWLGIPADKETTKKSQYSAITGVFFLLM